MRLNFVILGAQKSASTYLQHCLAQHPDVFIHRDECAIFEDPDYEHFSDDLIDRLFAGRTESRLGIKRPSYIGRREVPPRIQHAVPEAKLMAVLRNPVDRAVSGYFYYMAGAYIPLMDAEAGLRNLIEGRYETQYPRAHEILEFGKYHKYLSMYQHYLETGRMLLIRQEDLLSDPDRNFRRAFEFLDVDPRFCPMRQKAMRQAGHYNLISQRILRARTAVAFHKNEQNTRAFRRNSLARRLSGKALYFASTLLSEYVLDNRKPKLSDACTASLYGYYRDDVEKLEALTGWDLSSWKIGAKKDKAAAKRDRDH